MILMHHRARAGELRRHGWRHVPVRLPLLHEIANVILQARELAELILADKLPVRFQLQLHKLLWDNAPGH